MATAFPLVSRSLLALALCSLAGSFLSVSAEPPPSDQAVGFYLFRDVCDQETQVHLITDIKTTPPDVTAYVKKVSQVADNTMTVIGRLEKSDPSLRLNHNPLPAFEQAVRADIRADKQHQLLFGTKGNDFARALLVAQIEATTYIGHMAKILAREDKDADRAATLEKVSARWLALRTEGFRLLDADR